MAFVVPCLAIVVCYARIFYIVRKTAMRSHEPAAALTATGSMLIKSQPSTKNNNKPVNNKHFHADEANKQLIDQRKLSLIDAQKIGGGGGGDVVHPATTTEENSESSSISYYIHPRPISGPKILLKFIDSSVDSDLPPSLSRLRQASLSGGGGGGELKPLTGRDRKLSSVSISKNVEFFDDVAATTTAAENAVDQNGCDATGGEATPQNGGSFRRKRRRSEVLPQKEFDSAVEVSTSSSDNNQVSAWRALDVML